MSPDAYFGEDGEKFHLSTGCRFLPEDPEMLPLARIEDLEPCSECAEAGIEALKDQDGEEDG